MEYTEDETFKRLSRAPFCEIRKLWNSSREYGGLTLEELSRLGWTHREYIDEHYRRWRNNEL